VYIRRLEVQINVLSVLPVEIRSDEFAAVFSPQPSQTWLPRTRSDELSVFHFVVGDSSLTDVAV